MVCVRVALWLQQPICICCSREADRENQGGGGCRDTHSVQARSAAFSRSTRKASESCLHKGEFADDMVLMARSKDAAAAALRLMWM